MTYREVWNWGKEILRHAGIPEADLDAWFLLEYVTGMTKTQYYVRDQEEMDSAKRKAYEEYIKRRGERIPLQHITGVQEFMGYPFAVDETVLIPRQDTEILVEEADRVARQSKAERILDVCTGSGCVLLSLLKMDERRRGVGSDLSGDALKVAEMNREKLGISKERCTFFKSDLFEKIEGDYDLIVSNPPYIRTEEIEKLQEEVRLYDPYEALDGKEDGLYFYRRMISEAGLYLRKGGSLLFEIGYDQAEEVSGLFKEAGFEQIRVKKDLAGLDRVVGGVYNKARENEEELTMGRALIIGCGGVAGVVIHKCCQNSDVFEEIMIASRTKSKCDAIKEKLDGTTATKIRTAKVDADNVDELCALIDEYKPDIVMNIALPYQDLTIMDACLKCGVNYMDTANYEPEDTDDPEWRAIYEKRCKEEGFTAYFDYSWQWAYKKKFEDAGLTALLGSGFDPGVTQAYCAYAQKHLFDEIDTIDILDCNGGDHGYPFATNFNPEINLREVSAPGSYWENGHWVEIPAMSIKREYDFDQVGHKDMYLLHHEEIESLAKNIPGVQRIRFFMTFGQSYLTHMKCLENVGMLSTTPIEFEGHQIVPIQFLKALLPDPATLGPRTKGKTNIGCIFTGKKDGKEKTAYIYNVCDHEECYREVGSQAISYTTGVPAMIGAAMLLTGKWNKPGVYTVEEFDPDPYMEALNKWGLPWQINDKPVLVD